MHSPQLFLPKASNKIQINLCYVTIHSIFEHKATQLFYRFMLGIAYENTYQDYVKMEAQCSIKHILRRTPSKINQILNVLEIFSWYAMNSGNVKFQILNHGDELNFGIALPPQFTC